MEQGISVHLVCSYFDVFLEMGLDYCPPSQYLLPVLEHDEGKQEVDCVDGEEMAWQVSLHCLLVISYSA